MGFNSYIDVSKALARAFGQVFREKILPHLADGERARLDGSVTDEPDDGTFIRDNTELHKNHGASTEWLIEFTEFCERCNGFVFG